MGRQWNGQVRATNFGTAFNLCHQPLRPNGPIVKLTTCRWSMIYVRFASNNRLVGWLWSRLPLRGRGTQSAAGRCAVKFVLGQECSMAQCDVCGNDYDKAFRVTQGDRTMTFDSFECAIEAMAPRCAHCKCRVVGHGIEAKDKIYCCARCARHEGVQGVSDRAA